MVDNENIQKSTDRRRLDRPDTIYRLTPEYNMYIYTVSQKTSPMFLAITRL